MKDDARTNNKIQEKCSTSKLPIKSLRLNKKRSDTRRATFFLNHCDEAENIKIQENTIGLLNKYASYLINVLAHEIGRYKKKS